MVIDGEPPSPTDSPTKATQSATSTQTVTERPATATPTDCPSGGRGGCTSFPCLVFEDEFNSLDFTRWQHEITAGGGGNWEFQYYTNNRSNSYVRDGTLFIKPTLTTDKYGPNFLSTGHLNLWGSTAANQCTGNQFWGCERRGSGTNYINPIQSARMRTSNSFSFKYGRVEVEAKMPAGDWIWPAIWLLPQNNEYGDWPASGEIDIVESRGNRNLKTANGDSRGNDYAGSTLHWGPFPAWNQFYRTHGSTKGNFASTFSKYRMDWDEHSIKFYINNQLILNVNPKIRGFWELGQFEKRGKIDNPWAAGSKMAPFDKPFYLIMNVAVGGTNGFFGDPPHMNNFPHPKPWRNTSPTAAKDFWEARDQWYPTWNPHTNNGEDAALQVKYVRVWKMKA